MPESPVSSQKFSAAPPGKAMTAEEMQAAMSSQLHKAAAALGGHVLGEEIDDPVQIKPVAPPAMEVDDNDRKAYIRSLLAKEPFTKVYSLFGGILKVAFRTRKVSENDNVMRAYSEPRERHLGYMRQSLIGIEIVQESKVTPVTLDELEDVSYSAVCQAFKDFEKLSDELFRRANDPDFWTKTAGRI